MEIDDVLAPWEYSQLSPPKLCEVYRFPLVWKGEKKSIFAALIADDTDGNSKYLAFRVEGEDASWTLGGKDGGGTEKFYSQFVPSCSIVERRIKAAFNAKSLYRQFAFNWDENPDSVWIATLSSTGFAYWTQQIGGRTTLDKTRFYFPAENLFESKAKDWHDRLAIELENPDSDAVYARQLLPLGLLPRRARMLGLKSENETEQFLSPLILLWKMVATSHYGHHVRVGSATKACLISMTVRGQAEFDALESVEVKAHPSYTRLQFWAEVLYQQGLLPIDFSSLRKYTALRDTFKKHGYQVAVWVDPNPTSHEYLEAKLQLLEWAKTHLPPEKYAEVEAMEA